MKQWIIALLFASASADKAPLSGKFFYSTFKRNPFAQFGMHYMDVDFNDERFQLFVTTQETGLAVFTTDCDRCHVPKKLHLDEQTRDPEPSFYSEEGHFFDDKDKEMETMRFFGESITTTVNITLEEYNRSTAFTAHAHAITQSSHEFENVFQGYMGIAPYTALPEEERQHSFLYALKQSGKIDHVTVALYAREDDDLSLVKFGSYDKEAMEDKAYNLKLYKTQNIKTWALRTTYASINSREIFSGNRNFVLDPQNPYIYLPAKDWSRFAIDMVLANPDVRCSDNFNHFCWIKKPCRDVPDMGLDLRMIVTDGDQAHEYFIPQHEFLVNGGYMGGRDDYCQFGVRKNLDGDRDTVYIGNIFLKSHYVFFDMSPYDERGEDYIQVGIGPMNPKSIIGESHYDPSFNSTDGQYMPEDVTNDMSVQNFGEDPYNSDKYDAANIIRKEMTDEDADAFALQWVKNHRVETIIAVSMTLLGLVLCFIICCYYCCKKKAENEREYVGSLMIAFTEENHGMASNMNAINQDLDETK